MADERDLEAVLITGAYGSGKSSVAVEIADVLEKHDLPYAVLDLDFLAWNRSELDSLKAHLPMPLRVVRLTAPWPEIERRLRSNVTTGRQDDLREAAAQAASSEGVGIEDLTVSNDRPIRQVALDIFDWLGWK